jgi:hypothetical protein
VPDTSKSSRSEDPPLSCPPKNDGEILLRTLIEYHLLKEKIAVLKETDRVNKQQIINLGQQLEISSCSR